MNVLGIIPGKLLRVLRTLKSFLQDRFVERYRPLGAVGRRRIARRWVLVALALVGVSNGLTWRALAVELERCKYVLIRFGVFQVPSKSSLHAVWLAIREEQLENLIKRIGASIAPHPRTIAMDSTGFMLKGGSVWRLLKWNISTLKKTSRLFWKVHILVDTDTQAVPHQGTVCV